MPATVHRTLINLYYSYTCRCTWITTFTQTDQQIVRQTVMCMSSKDTDIYMYRNTNKHRQVFRRIEKGHRVKETKKHRDRHTDKSYRLNVAVRWMERQTDRQTNVHALTSSWVLSCKYTWTRRCSSSSRASACLMKYRMIHDLIEDTLSSLCCTYRQNLHVLVAQSVLCVKLFGKQNKNLKLKSEINYVLGFHIRLNKKKLVG